MSILLDKKKKRDGRLLGRNKGAKIEKVFFEDVFWINLLYWLGFCFFGIDVGVCRENHVKKSRYNNLGLGTNSTNTNGRADNSNITIDTVNTDRKANNLGIVINITDTNRRVDLGKSTEIVDVDEKVDKSSTDTNTINASRKTDYLGKSTKTVNINREIDPDKRINKANVNIVEGANNPNIDAWTNKSADNSDIDIKTADIDRQAIASNKAGVSLFFLHRVFFEFFYFNWRLYLSLYYLHLFFHSFQWF